MEWAENNDADYILAISALDALVAEAADNLRFPSRH
jgi:hypothetical protein